MKCAICEQETQTFFWLPSKVDKLPVMLAVCRSCYMAADGPGAPAGASKQVKAGVCPPKRI